MQAAITTRHVKMHGSRVSTDKEVLGSINEVMKYLFISAKDDDEPSRFRYEDITNEDAENWLCVEEDPNVVGRMANDSIDLLPTVIHGCNSDSKDTDEVSVDVRGVKNISNLVVVSPYVLRARGSSVSMRCYRGFYAFEKS